MVVPPGEVTFSFNSAGCSPVSRTIRAVPSYRLRRQLGGNIPCQAVLDPGICQSFNKGKYIAGTTSGQAGHCIHLLFFHTDRNPDQGKYLPGQIQVVKRGLPSGTDSSRTGTDQGRCIGHGTDHAAAGRQTLFNCCGRYSGHNRDHNFFWSNGLLEQIQHTRRLLRFDRQDNDIPPTGRLGRIFDNPYIRKPCH